MNDPGEITGRTVSPRRRHAAVCCLAMLHVVMLSVGLFAWSDVRFEAAAIVGIPLVFAGYLFYHREAIKMTGASLVASDKASKLVKSIASLNLDRSNRISKKRSTR